jgi:flagellum-specific peptidoglycan hydrolase FlgJ
MTTNPTPFTALPIVPTQSVVTKVMKMIRTQTHPQLPLTGKYSPKHPYTAFAITIFSYLRKLESNAAIPMAVTLTQAIVESKSNRDTLPASNIPAVEGNNLFGVLAPRGATVYSQATVGGKVYRYRKYRSIDESFDDFGSVLTGSRYKKAFLTSSPILFFKEVAAAGYGGNGLAYFDEWEGLLKDNIKRVQLISQFA